MKNWSIDNKLWLCVLSPTFVSCVILVSVFLIDYRQQLETDFVARGEIISRKIVEKVSISDLNSAQIQEFLQQQLVIYPNIRSVRIVDENSAALIEVGPALPSPLNQKNLRSALNSVLHLVEDQNSFFICDMGPSSNTDNRLLVLEVDRTELQLRQFRLALKFSSIAAFVFVLVAIMFAFLKRILVRPFTELRENMELLSHGEVEKLSFLSGGEPSDGESSSGKFLSGQTSSGQPFDVLFNYLHRTAKLIHSSRQELHDTVEQATSDLRQTLETVEEQNIELNIARKQALAASNAKSEFLSNTSHEIRTPINGIIGFVQLLLKSELNRQQQDYLHNIEKSSQGLLTVINNILDVSKIETGQLVLDYVPFSLDEIIEDSIDMFATAAREKNITLQTKIDSNVPLSLLGDPLRLKQILWNLIGNAVKFSDRGEVSVNVRLAQALVARREKTELVFSVCDQGKGIDTESQQRLFQLFSQVDSSDSREQGGTGLGLSVAKGLVSLMQGAIGVDSTAQQGSTFWFRVNLGVNQRESEIELGDLHETTARPRFSANILAVDDTPANLHLIGELLKGLGVNASLANNGMEALGLCEKQTFDLVFMDIQMPVIDGLETTRRIRHHETPPARMPIVALTAHAMTDQKTELLLAGLDDYLSKPISESHLVHVLKRWVGKNALCEKTELPLAPKKGSSTVDTMNGNVANPVDIQMSLQLSNQKADLARDMLAMLLKDLPEQRDKISLYQNNDDLSSLEQVVHKIRGGASYCGVPNLKTTSSIADEELRTKRCQEKSIQTLLSAMDELITWSEEMDVDALFDVDTTV